MTDKQAVNPTDSELEILRVLWDRGPSTVRQVHELISETKSTAYTTTLKLMQIMAEKGLVSRDESSRSHIYKARAAESQTQRSLVRNLFDKAFGGSAYKLVMQALDVSKTSKEELEQIRKLIDDYEAKESAEN